MTKHVEIWTLSKESKVVPYMTSSVEFYEYYPPPDMYVMDGKFEDKVERRYMNIIQVTKYKTRYKGFWDEVFTRDLHVDRTDKYIAIHPDVEEAISVKWQKTLRQVVSDYEDRLNTTTRLAQEEIEFVRYKLGRFELILDLFTNLPWYKRIWRAVWNSI